jgi:hypothetical protein
MGYTAVRSHFGSPYLFIIPYSDPTVSLQQNYSLAKFRVDKTEPEFLNF